MGRFLAVACGGALGAAGRYGISLLPVRGDFPVLTLATNLLGALLIGFLVGVGGQGRMPERWMLFWKTGVCGGFTTFSTFSLEAWALVESGRYLHAGLYIGLSVGLCLAGVAAGTWAGRMAAGR